MIRLILIPIALVILAALIVAGQWYAGLRSGLEDE